MSLPTLSVLYRKCGCKCGNRWPHPHDSNAYCLEVTNANDPKDSRLWNILARRVVSTKRRLWDVGVFPVANPLFLNPSVIVASIVRIASMTTLKTSLDVTWVMGRVYLWSQIEISLAVVCACLPTLQPILRMWAVRLTSSKDSRPVGESSSFQQLSRRRRSSGNRNMDFRPDGEDTTLTCSSARVEMDDLRDSDLEMNAGKMSIKVQRDFDVREE